jgi:putative aldouronate transport system permease protein
MEDFTMAKEGVRKRAKWNSRDITLFVMASFSIVFLAVFSYAPLFGLTLAFKDGDYKLNLLKAITDTKWVQFDNFKAFLLDPNFVDAIKNTIGLNLIMLLINFPAPILFALLINEVRHTKYKKTVQTLTNFPHFISWVIFGGMIIAMTDMTTGIFNPILNFLGLSSNDNPVNLQGPDYAWATIIISSLIKGVGWGSIVYIAAIAGLDADMYEAADLEGANRFQKAIYITLPGIAPTITVFALLNISNLLKNSFDQFYILQNSLNLSKMEVLSTYVYKTGMSQRRYSYASALGLFNSVISVGLLIVSNTISKKLTGRGVL